MKKITATLLAFSIFFSIDSALNLAKASQHCVNGNRLERFFCNLRPKPTQPAANNVTQESDVVNPQTISEIGEERFQEYLVGDFSPNRGYVRVGYRLTDGKNPYGNLGSKVNFFEASLLDWAKRYFTDSRKLVIVNLEVLKNDEVIWIKPVVSFEFNKTLTIREISDSRSLNGSTGFYDFSEQELTVRLAAYYADVTAINRTRLDKFTDLADDLVSSVSGFGGLPSVDNLVSVFDVKANQSYGEKIDNMLEELQGFASVQAISRDSTFKYAPDGVGLMSYHFFAKDVEFKAFKLEAFLDYRESLIGSSASNDILSYSIYNKNDNNFQKIESYIASHDASRNLVNQITSKQTLLNACGGIRDALNDVLTAADASVVLNAYIIQKPAIFSQQNWDEKCLTVDDRDALKRRHTRIAFSDIEPELHIQAAADQELEDYATAVGLLFLIDMRNVVYAASSQSAVWLQGESSRMRIVDRIGLLFPTPETREQGPKDLTERLISKNAKKYGCISRKLRSSDEEPNVISMLVKDDKNRDIDIKIAFESAPLDIKDPKIKSIEIDFLTIENKSNFKSLCPESTYFN